MQIKPKSSQWDKIVVDTVVLFVAEGSWEKDLAQVNKQFGGFLTTYLKLHDFEAKLGSARSYPTNGKIAAHTLLLVGTGPVKSLDSAGVRQVCAVVAGILRSHKLPSVALDLSSLLNKEKALVTAHAATEGLLLGSYRFEKYKSEAREKPFELKTAFLLTSPSHIQEVANGIGRGQLYAQATLFARDLINESPTITTPTYLANSAKKLAKKGEITVEVMDEKEVRKLGMNAFLAVSRGSAEPPKFIKLTYLGNKRKIVLAGKAITFDTGGLSLKDAKNMETMKLDMAGAASVLGVFSVLPQIKPKETVIGLIAACENMPGARATKPGDIVTALNGKTIEILNTDAEGRLTLADVLSYAVREKPEYIVDLATLTGACMVALGEDIAGLFSNNVELTQKLLHASKTAGEKMWELPLEKDYKDLVKSEIADLSNTGKSRYGGAITAALFLEEFVSDVPWAHVDIAGPAFAEKGTPQVAKGGAGFGVRMLLELLTQ